MNNTYLICLVVFCFSSCNLGDSDVESTQSAKDTTQIKVTLPEVVDVDNYEDTWNDSVAIFYAENLGESHGEISYAFRNNGKLFFLAKKNLNGKDYQGIIDSVGNEIVPFEYKKIGNPGVIAKDYMEVKGFNNLHGVIHIDNGTKTGVNYDVIYPSEDPKVLAYAKLPSGIVSLDFAGNQVEDNLDYPNYNVLAGFWTQQVSNKEIEIFHAIDYDERIFVIPSYLLTLDFPEQIFDNYDYEWRKEEIFLKPVISSNIYSTFLTEFVASGVGVRDYEYYNSSSKLVILDNKNEIIETQEVSGSDFKIINDSLIEIKFKHIDPDKQDEYYSEMTSYEYFKLNSNGSLQLLESNRMFDFTSFVKITPAYFEGEYHKWLTDDEIVKVFTNEEEREYMNAYWTSAHLSIEALDIMRNEIFASYGLKFTTERWVNYFESKSWYSPQFDNVDDQLTEIEKHNIQVILDTKAAMKNNEESFTKKTMITIDERAG